MSTTIRRADALDALRGLAILLMVLSGSIHFPNALPAWMYHAQVPPPDFKFNPDLPGITWVDLVFPFFLFAMGAAFPFGLSKKIESGVQQWKINLQIVQRGLLLVGFAIFVQHTKPFAFSADPTPVDWIIGLVSFFVLFLLLVRFPQSIKLVNQYVLKSAAAIGAVAILSMITFPDGSGFSLTRSDIIIIVLANVAVAGSLIWIYTRNNMLLRLSILGILIELSLTQNIEGSWNQWLWNLSPVPWMYKLYYLQYLFIVIPGTIAGDLIYGWINTPQGESVETEGVSRSGMLALFLIMSALLVVTVAGLFSRNVIATIGTDILIFVAGFVILQKALNSTERLYKTIFNWGSFWLMLGFFFEAYEGGIKKDHPTMSYYFVTTGLAMYTYIAFSIFADRFKKSRYIALLIDNGKNPMIAYVAGNILVLPILSLTSLSTVLHYLTVSPWLGFVKGLIFTLLVALSTSFFTKKGLFWRT
jgi:predicted acyltransferase